MKEAGRVIIRRNGGLKEKLINIKRDLVMIPNLAYIECAYY